MATKSFAKSIEPYAGLLGALLVFFSWVTNSYLVDRAASDSRSANAIAAQERQFENFRRIYDWQTNAERSLSLLVQRGNLDGDTFKTEMQKRLYWATERLGKLNAPNLEVQYLFSFIHELTRNSNGLSQTLQISDEIQILKLNFDIWFHEISDLNKERRKREGGIIGTGLSVNAVRADQVEEMETLARDIVSRYENLYNSGYLDFVNTALRLSSEMVVTAESIASASARQASIFTTISFFLYFVGTIMIIYSKYQDI
ncbi:hypothetical protein A5320_13895 [Rheinheimera sp. SA_1]|jgi:hypothetical protein|uniref:hypothetical protein n=1 Tax=Rheinheimera sp. SA_1 TaxID=1827365 RepID=UPI00080192C6|nr:hypothetical protein [Rheinheimera sp. SA_1]OBP14806.1 hypothetical protein A5320_13895 [Rheinheimera sp. SA_1]